MSKIDRQGELLDRSSKANGREIAVRAHMARRGYRLMHRRNGQYWVMLGDPMTLDEIEAWVRPRNRFRP
jgi:hypothetical protein